jgi:hypothetical protein
MRKSRTFFLVRIPIQNPSRTLAFADHKRSEVGRELTIKAIKL